MSQFLSDMRARSLVQQVTDEQGLEQHLSTGGADRKAYVGFDPTADSLTIGNLVGIMSLARFQRAGHTPFALMGGATGLIGDPSGKSAERTLNTREVVEANVKRIERIFDGILDFSPAISNRAQMVNNIDWLGNMGFLEALREIGKHFSVNMMIQKDSVKERLNNRDQGISYTEFSYMLLQGYDFAHLCEKQGVTLQMGGSDQFGNIVVGGDLIRRRHHHFVEETSRNFVDLVQRLAPDDARSALVINEFKKPRVRFIRTPETDAEDSLLARAFDEVVSSINVAKLTPADVELLAWSNHLFSRQYDAFGLTWPLVTKADGTKFGKTESGAIWLTADRTSPYAYYQFWLNAADADVIRLLKTYTFLSKAEIDQLEQSVATNPGARDAQRALAQHATKILHGEPAMLEAERAGKAVFSGDIAGLSLEVLTDAFGALPRKAVPKDKLGAGLPLLDTLVETGLASSKREAKEFVQAGAVTINGRKVGAEDLVSSKDLLHGKMIVMKRGKKNTVVIEAV